METPIWFLTLLATLFFIVALWCTILLFASKVGGWSKLAVHFAAKGPFEGTARRRFQRLQLGRATGYKSCITFGVDDIGLWISTSSIFRFRHPDLLIPWGEIEASTSRESPLTLTFPSVPGVTASISRRLFEELATEAGVSFGAVESAP